MRPRISSSDSISRAASKADSPSTSVRMCPTPCRSSEDVVITVSAPASKYLKTSSADSTPVLAASDAGTRPWRIAIHSSGKPNLGRRAEFEIHRQAERRDVDVGLVEAVEQHQRVGAGIGERTRHGADRAEVRTDLDRDGDRHRRLHGRQDVEIALFDVATGHRQIGGDEVDVELDRVGAGLLQAARVVDPAGV